EHAVPGAVGDDAHLEPIVRIRAAVHVLDEDLATLEIGGKPPAHAVEDLFGHRLVDVAPPDVGFARRLLDDVFVLWGAAGIGAGAGHEGAAGADEALLSPDGILV